MAMKKAAIIMGSDSDLPVVEKAFSVFEEFGVPYEVHVYSAHRTPAEARAFVTGARENGFGVIIAATGKAAHLAGAPAYIQTGAQVLGVIDAVGGLYYFLHGPECRRGNEPAAAHAQHK